MVSQLKPSLLYLYGRKIFSFWAFDRDPQNPNPSSSPWYYRIFKQRFIRLTFIALAIVSETAIVYSWQPFSSMLFADEIYGWNCSIQERQNYHKAIEKSPSRKYEQMCQSQNESVQLLYNVYSASEYISGAIAGVLFDYYGPLITGFWGQVTFILGLVMFYVSTQSLTLYIPSMISLGAAANLIVFSALAMPDYFPQWEGLIVSLIIALQNGGSIVSTCLDQIYRRYHMRMEDLIFYYFFFWCVPIGILFIASLPLVRLALNPRLRNFDKPLELTHQKTAPTPTTLSIDCNVTTTAADSITTYDKSNYHVNHNDALIVEAKSSEQEKQKSPKRHSLTPERYKSEIEDRRYFVNSPSVQSISYDANLKCCKTSISSDTHNQMASILPLSVNSLLEPELERVKSFELRSVDGAHLRKSSRSLSPHNSIASNKQHDVSLENTELMIPSSTFLRTYSLASSVNKEMFPLLIHDGHDNDKLANLETTFSGRKSTIATKGVFAYLTSLEFTIFTILVIAFTLQFSYYPVVLRNIAGNDVANFNGYIFPTQAIWGVLFGMVVVYTNTLPILAFLFILDALVYAFSLASATPYHYVATALFVLGSTYIYSCKFTYVVENFPPQYNGVLIGYLSVASGLTMGLNVILVKIQNIRGVLIGLLISVLLCIPTIIWLWYRQSRKNKNITNHIKRNDMQI